MENTEINKMTGGKVEFKPSPSQSVWLRPLTMKETSTNLELLRDFWASIPLTGMWNIADTTEDKKSLLERVIDLICSTVTPEEKAMLDGMDGQRMKALVESFWDLCGLTDTLSGFTELARKIREKAKAGEEGVKDLIPKASE